MRSSTVCTTVVQADRTSQKCVSHRRVNFTVAAETGGPFTAIAVAAPLK
jgi:hypothetical protein